MLGGGAIRMAPGGATVERLRRSDGRHERMTKMAGGWVKRPGALLDHTFGWEVELGRDTETIAADLGWTVEPDEGRRGGITVTGTRLTPTTTTVFLAGGVPGRAYRLASRIRTTGGREIERRSVIRIGHD
jgi:hypothetical protein